jgi:hypothetical protein
MTEPVWLRGYFTDRLHAVTRRADRMVFHEVAIVWSVCGRATVLEFPAHDRIELCDRCVRLAGPPPVSGLQ